MTLGSFGTIGSLDIVVVALPVISMAFSGAFSAAAFLAGIDWQADSAKAHKAGKIRRFMTQESEAICVTLQGCEAKDTGDRNGGFPYIKGVMTTKSNPKKDTPINPFDLDRMAQTWGEIMRLSGDVAREWVEKSEKQDWMKASADPFNLHGAWTAFFERMASQPDQLTAAQFDLWQNYVSIWENAMARYQGNAVEDVIPGEPGDRRFKAEAWHKDALFAFIRQSYLLTSRWMMTLVEDNTEALEPEAAKKLKFFTKAFVDALSPTNFAFTNPDVLKATMESGGENLVRGMKNLLEDMKRGSMRMTDETAFKLGENIATTPGQVIFRNKLFELIHYAPAGDTTFATPLLIVPPWINKYYILDLRPDNSFVKWAVSQGHSVFMISWANPDASMKDVQFEDYMQDGILQALAAVEKQTGSAQTNIIGYCIGGTLLSMTLSWMKAKGQSNRIASATFFTTLIDFDNSGDLKLFVDEEQLEALHDRMAAQGFLDAESLKATFNLLRANDLIWSFVINNYLMGREPFPFDLLYWNSDSTNLPAKMHEYYLRHMYLKNELKEPCALEFSGVKIDVSTIDTPAYFLSTREDHIAPWKATYAGAQLFSGPTTFTLSGSGHIAGVVNPPTNNKYGYWTGTDKGDADQWIEKAEQHDGSWWPHWQEWIEQFAGKQVPAVDPASGPLKALVAAPGTYVRKKA